MNIPPIFVITNPIYPHRKLTMYRRLKNMNLIDKTTFITGGNPNGELVNHYNDKTCDNGIIACLIGHIKALRSFIETGSNIGCILEDDVLFHKDFIEIIANQKVDTLIQLYTMSSNHSCNKTCFGIYGTQGYLISSHYALYWLKNFDKPIDYWISDRFKTSECITMYSNGHVIFDNPPIIEDCLSFTITNNYNPSYTQIYASLIPSYSKGLHNYIGCDPEFKFKAYLLKYLFEEFIKPTIPSNDLALILKRVTHIQTDTENLLFCILNMLCYYYIDKNIAYEFANIFFHLKQKIEKNEILEKFNEHINRISSFFH